MGKEFAELVRQGVWECVTGSIVSPMDTPAKTSLLVELCNNDLTFLQKAQFAAKWKLACREIATLMDVNCCDQVSDDLDTWA
jgi:hypothetical protein